VLTNKFNEKSDIDLIVAFDKQKIADYFNNFFDFKYSLEDIFKRKVDLFEERPIQNQYFRESIENSKQLIYGQNEKMA
jgi:predicted nucleotidyltransferase